MMMTILYKIIFSFVSIQNTGMVISKPLHQVFHYAGVTGTRSLMVIFSVEPCFTCIIIERFTGSYICTKIMQHR